MNLISSCQAITYTLLVNQPYRWYIILVLGLFFLKVVSTLYKVRTTKHQSSTWVPKKVAQIFKSHQFPLTQVRILSTAQSLAFTSGFLRPHINISRGLIQQLTPKQLEAVILHEIYHARHYHPLQVALSKILASALALLPIVDDLVHYHWLVLETQADHFAHHHQASTRYLQGALAKMLIVPMPELGVGFVHHSLDQRVRCLVSNRRPPLKLQPLKVLLSCLMLAGMWWYSHEWQNARAFENEYHLANQCTLTRCISKCVNETLSGPAATFSPDIRYSSVD